MPFQFWITDDTLKVWPREATCDKIRRDTYTYVVRRGWRGSGHARRFRAGSTTVLVLTVRSRSTVADHTFLRMGLTFYGRLDFCINYFSSRPPALVVLRHEHHWHKIIRTIEASDDKQKFHHFTVHFCGIALHFTMSSKHHNHSISETAATNSDSSLLDGCHSSYHKL